MQLSGRFGHLNFTVSASWAITVLICMQNSSREFQQYQSNCKSCKHL